MIPAQQADREKCKNHLTESRSHEELYWGYLRCLMQAPVRDFTVLLERAHFLTDGVTCQEFFYQISTAAFDGMTI